MEEKYKKRAVGFCLGFFAPLFFVTAFFLYFAYKKSSYLPKHYIVVEYADNDEYLSGLLTNEGISSNVLVAKVTIKTMKRFGYKAKFGEYGIPARSSLVEALKIFASGNVVIHKITIPEGFSSFQVINRLKKDKFLLGDIVAIPNEGSLLPDTYHFKYPTTRQQIISKAKQAMREFVQQEWPKRSSECFLKTPEEALTLASIVEKETASENEKYMVAGVYLRRLKINMKLQACPTVIYAHTRGGRTGVFGGRLRFKDLEIDDPYNTYRYEGLPPTPITNPGKKSIIAALHPKSTECLFFVFDIGLRHHVFSKTFDEHKRNIKRIQLNKDS